MEKYLEKRHVIRNSLKILTSLSCVALISFFFIYMFLKIPTTFETASTFFCLIPLFTIPLSLFFAYRQLSIMKRSKLVAFDLLELVGVIVTIVVCFGNLIYVNLTNASSKEIENTFLRATLVNLSVLLTQWILLHI